MKHPIQVTFFDITTSSMRSLDTFDNIVGTGKNCKYNFIPIPHKGDIVNFAKDGEFDKPSQNYKVIEIHYSYKHLFDPDYIFTYVKVFVKKL